MFLDISSNQIFISRDLNFFQHIFPYKNSNQIKITNSFVFPIAIIILFLIILHNLKLPSIVSSCTNFQQNNQNVVRRSNKVTNSPKYLTDYHRYNVTHSSTTNHPIQSYLNYSTLSNSHKHYIYQIYKQFEPQTYSQAIKFVP